MATWTLIHTRPASGPLTVLTYIRRNLQRGYSCSLFMLSAWEHWVDSLIYCTLKCNLSLMLNFGNLAPVTYVKVGWRVSSRMLVPLWIDLLPAWPLFLSLPLSHLVQSEIIYRLFIVTHASLDWGEGSEQGLLLEAAAIVCCCLLLSRSEETHLLWKGKSQVGWGWWHLIVEIIQNSRLSRECWMVLSIFDHFWFVVLVSCRLEGVATNLSLKSHCEFFEFIL